MYCTVPLRGILTSGTSLAGRRAAAADAILPTTARCLRRPSSSCSSSFLVLSSPLQDAPRRHNHRALHHVHFFAEGSSSCSNHHRRLALAESQTLQTQDSALARHLRNRCLPPAPFAPPRRPGPLQTRGSAETNPTEHASASSDTFCLHSVDDYCCSKTEPHLYAQCPSDTSHILRPSPDSWWRIGFAQAQQRIGLPVRVERHRGSATPHLHAAKRRRMSSRAPALFHQLRHFYFRRNDYQGAYSPFPRHALLRLAPCAFRLRNMSASAGR